EFDVEVLNLFKKKLKLLINEDELCELFSTDKRGIVRFINKVLGNRTYSKDAKLIFQKLFEEICSKFDQELIKLYCSICKQEVFEKDGCIHLLQRIDFVEVFEFVQFSKDHCDYEK
ncbi:577_t:CDS:1, partial [Racocetra persica]